MTNLPTHGLRLLCRILLIFIPCINLYAQKSYYILQENFNYPNIESFRQKNVYSLKSAQWDMANEWQYSSNILHNKTVDINIIKNKTIVTKNQQNYAIKSASSLREKVQPVTLSGQGFIDIINNVKETQIVQLNNKNWLALTYKTPILSPIDLLTLRNIINNSFNAGQKLQQNYKVYFTRNEIYTAKQQTKIYPEKDYWVDSHSR